MNDRTCIVTRRPAGPDELIRFVVGPDGAVVPDLKRNLPGRGCWVTADREHVEKATKKGLFARAFKSGAFKSEVTVPADLGGMVDRLLGQVDARRARAGAQGGSGSSRRHQGRGFRA